MCVSESEYLIQEDIFAQCFKALISLSISNTYAYQISLSNTFVNNYTNQKYFYIVTRWDRTYKYSGWHRFVPMSVRGFSIQCSLGKFNFIHISSNNHYLQLSFFQFSRLVTLYYGYVKTLYFWEKFLNSKCLILLFIKKKSMFNVT